MPMKLHRDNFRWTNGRGHNQKPILYAQKTNTHGLGKQAHPTDQWWLNAFDSQLKSLDVTTSKTDGGSISVTQTQKNNPLSMSISSRYYIRFVRGGLLKGGLEEKVEVVEREETATPGGTDDELRAKRRGEDEKKKKKSKKDRKERKEKKAEKKDKKEKSKGKSKRTSDDKEKKKRKSKAGSEETKEERKERKRLKRLVEKEMAALTV